jgi:hypothetical protein
MHFPVQFLIFCISFVRKVDSLEKIVRTPEQLAREKLSPFIETAIMQCLSEIPQTRSGYELCCRIERRVIERRKSLYARKKRPSKGRRRSARDKAKRDAWFAGKVADKPVYKATGQLDAPEERSWSSLQEYEDAIHAQVNQTKQTATKTQAQRDYEANLRTSREIDIERGLIDPDD